MRSVSVETPVVGAQRPSRLHVVPPYVSSAGDDAIEVAHLAGLDLDEWEQLVLRDALGEAEAGRWAAYRVGLEVPRQNGKGTILEARELAGLVAFGERLIIHSAHEQATATEHFNRLLALMEGVPDFDRRIRKVNRGKGSEAIELRDGARIFFKTRTGGGARGFTGDLVVFDEAMILAAAFMAALVPTMAARSIIGDPQLWFAGSPVDQDKTEHGIEFARVRADAIAGMERLAYFGWGLPYEKPDEIPEEVAADPESWAAANPGLGIRIAEQYVADERRALGAREFAVERLGVGDWPRVDGGVTDGLDFEAWRALTDPHASTDGPYDFAFDVTPSRHKAAIAVAGPLADGDGWFVEVVSHHSGTKWLPERLAELQERYESDVIVFDKRSPAAASVSKLDDEDVRHLGIDGSDVAVAAGLFFDAVTDATARHLGQQMLDAAVRGAVKAPLGDAWKWSRRSSHVDISPLVACTLALWRAMTRKPKPSLPLVARR